MSKPASDEKLGYETQRRQSLLSAVIESNEAVPLGEVWLARPGRVDKMVNLNRECGQGAVGGCELGLDHPGDCLGVHPSDPRRYVVWERGTGRLLREL